jgi:hypothetical protein
MRRYAVVVTWHQLLVTVRNVSVAVSSATTFARACVDMYRMQVAHPEQLFTLFLTNPVLAFLRLFGCYATAELLQRMDGLITPASGHLQKRVCCVSTSAGDLEAAL